LAGIARAQQHREYDSSTSIGQGHAHSGKPYDRIELAVSS